MPKKKATEPTPPPPARRSPEERRRRFGWDGDDVLHLQIDGEQVKSTPPADDE